MDEDHRVICWSINSLAVPYEKKTSIVSNGKFVVLLRARVSGSPPCLEPSEAYLCCIALLNLTFSAESVETHRLLRSAPFRCARDSGVPDACGREERMTMTRLSV